MSGSQDSRKVKKVHHWKWGQDPNDPDAYKGSPWTYMKVPAPEPEPVEPEPEMKYSIDTGVECFDCHHNTYRQVNDLPVDIVSGYDIMREEFHDTKVLLVCPNCPSRVQMYLSDLRELQQKGKGDA